MKIILSADRSCDLSEDLVAKYNVQYIYSPIHVGDKRFMDGIDVSPDDLYRSFTEDGVLPKTACVNVNEYLEHFKKWTDEGYEVIHIGLSSALSSCYQNAVIAAGMLEGVYTVDSRLLSSAFGLLVIEAGERIAAGMSAAKVAEEVQELPQYINCSFILDTLAYMKAGGRCSAMAAAGANLLNLKPCIEMDTSTGKLGVGKKYRGNLDKVLQQYATDRMEKNPKIRPEHIFITHSGISQERIDLVRACLEARGGFRNIHVVRASGIISSHCGPNTLGVLFMMED